MRILVVMQDQQKNTTPTAMISRFDALSLFMPHRSLDLMMSFTVEMLTGKRTYGRSKSVMTAFRKRS
jgi:hypothetical protein